MQPETQSPPIPVASIGEELLNLNRVSNKPEPHHCGYCNKEGSCSWGLTSKCALTQRKLCIPSPMSCLPKRGGAGVAPTTTSLTSTTHAASYGRIAWRLPPTKLARTRGKPSATLLIG